MVIKHEGGRVYDVLTGERVQLGENIISTGILTRSYEPERARRTQRELYIKEDTLVWLADRAGFDVVKRDAGDSGNTESVDGEDASVGGGEAKAGKAKARGRKSAS